MKKSENSIFFPILINLQKFPCLIIGGGNVALRKVQSLLLFNAKITVLSPRICKALVELNKKRKIKIISDSYSKKYIKNYKIVFSATNNQKINKKVQQDCNQEWILLNVVDNLPLCDFILPANIIRGALTLSIASQGKAPFFVKELKKKLAIFLSPNYNDIIEIAADFRKELLSNGKTSDSIKKAFEKFSEIDWEFIFERDGKKSAYKQMHKILDEHQKR